jgi:xanthine dehydrogenase large subunit
MAKFRSLSKILDGKSKFVIDLDTGDCNHCILIQSDNIRGKILNIRTPELPEGYHFITGSDLKANYVELFEDHIPIFAEDTVEYLGQALGILTGPDPVILSQLREQFQNTFEDLGARNTFPEYEPNQLFAQKELEYGSIEKAKKATDQIIQSEFYLDSRKLISEGQLSAFAKWNEGKLEVNCPSNWVSNVKKQLIKALKIRSENLVIYPTIPVKKTDRMMSAACLAAMYAASAAIVSKKSTIWHFDKTHSGNLSFLSAPVWLNQEIGVSNTGKIEFIETEIRINMGAFPLFSEEILYHVLYGFNRLYAARNQRITIKLITSNVAPMNISDGFLSAEVANILEIQMNRISELIQIDPLDLRTINLYKQGDFYPWGEEVKNNLVGSSILQHSLEVSDYFRKYASYELLRKRQNKELWSIESRKGIGLALGDHPLGMSLGLEKFFKPKIKVRIDVDGNAEIYSGLLPGSSSLKSIWRDQVMELLQLEDNQIKLRRSSTDFNPDDGPIIQSRMFAQGLPTLESLCKALQKKRFRDPLPLELTKSLSIAKGLKWENNQGTPFYDSIECAALVELEYYPHNFQIEIQNVYLSIDLGEEKRTEQVKSSLEEQIINSLHWCLSQSNNSSTDLSKMNIHIFSSEATVLKNKTAKSRKGAPKGLGTAVYSVVPAALLSALVQASGYYPDKIPLSSQDLYSYESEDEN